MVDFNLHFFSREVYLIFMFELFRNVLMLLKIVMSVEVPHMEHRGRNNYSSHVCVLSL